MLNELKNQINRMARTENGAVTHYSTDSDCLDLFAYIGSLRDAPDNEIVDKFMLAYAEDRDLAMKILFYARDVRGGLGERRAYRVILGALARTNKESVIKNIPYIAEFGRYDDMLALMDTPCEAEMLQELKRQFLEDMECLKEENKSVSLLGKWLPSVNATNVKTVARAKRIARAFGLKESYYRKALVALRARIRIIENNLREKDYTFNYESQPSRALFKYRKAFLRNDAKRYSDFIKRVKSGEVKMNTSNLLPYDIVKYIITQSYSLINANERDTLDVTWRNLPSFSGDDNSIVVVDGSGSMYGNDCTPISVALSLGIYIAEHINGEFKNHFITFSEHPRLVEIKGRDIVEKVRYCANFNEVANTNVEAVFRSILAAAVSNHIPKEDMVKRIMIISDMEFDQCTRNSSLTNFENAKAMFEQAGYELPEVVFWNVCSRNTHQPVTMNESGAVLVSGYTPRLFSMIAMGKTNPYDQMLEIIGSERYSMIYA